MASEARKVHWTQTPEGRKRMAEITKRSAITRRKNQKHLLKLVGDKPNVRKQSNLPEETFAYALGYLECWLTTYAASAGISREALTARMGQVLSSKASRK